MKKRGKYDTLMTEHERRVNDGDIKAYENNDRSTLNSKLPGFNVGNSAVQDRYIDKQFSPELRRQSQENRSQASLHASPSQGLRNLGLNRRAPHLQSSLIAAGQSHLHNQSMSNVDSSIVEEARRNMENPEALRYRGNTGNKLYGFD